MITIPDSALQEAALKGMDDFIDVFIKKYYEVLGGELLPENMHLLTGEQHVLLSYRIFRTEVSDGGFVQLIQNGYGSYIFVNPFAKAMRLWGMKEFSKLIYKAREIYMEHRADLEAERTEDEFMAMYEQYEQFDELEEEFLEMEEEVTERVARYVDENLALFGEIVK